jgi:peptide methionine sulfoxide reductase MsrA
LASAGNTWRIEALRVVYDPSRVTYAALVNQAFRTSDPTDGGGQFCDRGSQYRPAIFVASSAERKAAEAANARTAQRSASRSPPTSCRAAASIRPRAIIRIITRRTRSNIAIIVCPAAGTRR